MPLLQGVSIRRFLRVATAAVYACLFPAALHPQSVAREAFASFPTDTLQFACTDLAQLRSLPNYQEIRQRVFGSRLQGFEKFLQSMETDPEKDVDEVAIGWRGESMDSAVYFGLAQGRFQPGKFAEAAARSQLPSRSYAGQQLFAFGSGEGPNDIFFTFLTGSIAAFGRLRDVKAMLDVRNGDRTPLDANATFVAWETELEGTAPQWGIVTGQAASNAAMPWLAPGGKPIIDSGALLTLIQAVLYRIEWSGGFTANLSVVCTDAQSATNLYQLLKFYQTTMGGNVDNGGARFARDLQAEVDGARLNLRGSGSADVLQQAMRGPESNPAP